MLAVFELFGTSHIAATRTSLALLTFLCFAIYPLHQAFHTIVGGSEKLEDLFPFHLCDIAIIVCGFAIITRKPILCELAYFWGLAGTLQGLITPDLNHDFPSPVYLIFFFQHGIIVITALVLPLGLGWRPRSDASRRVFIWIIIYAVGAFLINFVMGTNFGFLTHKPEQSSLLDIMGPWPWYVLVLITLSGLFFWLLALPFKKRIPGEATPN